MCSLGSPGRSNGRWGGRQRVGVRSQAWGQGSGSGLRLGVRVQAPFRVSSHQGFGGAVTQLEDRSAAVSAQGRLSPARGGAAAWPFSGGCPHPSADPRRPEAGTGTQNPVPAPAAFSGLGRRKGWGWGGQVAPQGNADAWGWGWAQSCVPSKGGHLLGLGFPAWEEGVRVPNPQECGGTQPQVPGREAVCQARGGGADRQPALGPPALWPLGQVSPTRRREGAADLVPPREGEVSRGAGSAPRCCQLR